MGESKNESRLLLFVLAAILIPLGLVVGGGGQATDWSFVIIAAPMIAFPLILLAGQIWNGHPLWKNTCTKTDSFGVDKVVFNIVLTDLDPLYTRNQQNCTVN